MHKFARKLITEWRKLALIINDETIVVAVSGGADSCALLLAVHDLTKRQKLGHRIVVAHLNHGLRGEEAEADEDFVRELSERLGVEFVGERAKLAKRGNLEQNARRARYEFLSRVAERENAFAILTGHTMDDQAETLLMNLIRGAGPEGLSGMHAINGRIVRPLLTWARRSDTEDLCRDSGIDFRRDSMNDELAFRRVWIRKELIPMLATANPRIVETLASTAALMRQVPVTTTAAENLSVLELRKLDVAKRLAAIRSWLRYHRGGTRQIGLKHIEAVERLALSARSGRVAELPGGRVVKSSGKLTYEDSAESL